MNMINLNNQVTLRGYLVKAVQLSFYNDAKGEKRAIGRFTLAVKSGNRDDVEFIPVTVFGSGAETLSKYTNKGSQLLCSCMIRQNTYQKKVKGKTETIYGGLELVCQGFEFLSNPKNSSDETPEETSEEDERTE